MTELGNFVFEKTLKDGQSTKTWFFKVLHTNVTGVLLLFRLLALYVTYE
jgi:hypothetical protein